MRVAYSWLKDYIDPGITPGELAERLTLAGVEVGAVEPFAPSLSRVVTGLIKSVEPHPHDLKLSVARVEHGSGEISIVCGAANIAPGLKAPVALPGAVLHGGKRIEEVAVHGIASSGMLCSAAELGLEPTLSAGVLILDPGTVPGISVTEALGLNDQILYLEPTPNRADCLGMLGVAWEVAALTGGSVKLPHSEPPEQGGETGDAVRVSVQDPDLCPCYTARVVHGVTIRHSPLWMRIRLLKAGIRPVNNIVDITNYVMWEYGQPLHAFDYDLIRGGHITVRKARPGETMVTLDGNTRELDPSVLVIADSSGPVGLAGVMGGESTEINTGTRMVLLEAARFNPASIRRTARRYNLPSEASQRFERGVNPEWTPRAQDRAALLMANLAGGTVLRGMIDLDCNPPRPRRVTVRPHRINEILGMKIPVEETKDILKRLGFGFERTAAHTLEVVVPPRRRDISLEEDIVEEVARLHGYDNIPVTLPRGELVESRDAPEQRFHSMVRETLIACSFREAITYSFINPAHLDTLGLDEGDPLVNAIPLDNPISSEHSVMRTTLLPGMLKTLQHNFSFREMNQFFFELGMVYRPNSLPLDELPSERARLAMAATGSVPGPSWVAASRPANFFEIKGALEALFRRAGLDREDAAFIPVKLPFTHPTRAASVVIGGETIGFAGQLHPAVAERWDFPQDVSIAELDLEALFAAAKLVPRVLPLLRYPASLRDIAVVVPSEIPARELERCIREAGGGLVEDVVLFDLYQGEQIPAGKRSLAFSITYRRLEATLTESEVNEAQARIEQALAGLGASLRR